MNGTITSCNIDDSSVPLEFEKDNDQLTYYWGTLYLKIPIKFYFTLEDNGDHVFLPLKTDPGIIHSIITSILCFQK